MKLGKIVIVLAVIVMLVAAVYGLVYALIQQEFGRRSLEAMTVGLGALFIALGGLAIEKMNRRFHPESSLFLWSDVDNLRRVARESSDPERQAWALSLSERIAAVLPGRQQLRSEQRSVRST